MTKTQVETKIKELTRDIRIMEEIVNGERENYTQHSVPALQEAIQNYKEKLTAYETLNATLLGEGGI